jgi:eukaryotic-like serine/threonine-protein kinase
VPSSNQAEVTSPGIDRFIGQTIDGRFQIQELVGTGGMGRVYRATQKPLNRRVALKILNRGYGAATDELFRKRFMIEAKLTSQLSHPNTVTVLDYGCTADGDFWLAMEFLEGETLADLLVTTKALPWHRVLSIGQQVCRSLREAHKLGVVHRDLKPANVMLLQADDDHDQVKVLDFGLVKSFQKGPERGITKQGTLMGSPGYMAPEQAEHNISDPRSDIYSLGVVMYEALVGAPPFSGRHQIDVILKHINDKAPAPQAPEGSVPIPASVAAVVSKCLEKDPNDRYETMDELLAAMSQAAVPAASTPSLGVHNPVAAVAAAPPKSSSFGPAMLFLAAALIGVLGAAVLVYRAYAGGLPALGIPANAPAVSTDPIHFRLTSEPAGATVSMHGVALGKTPLEFDLPPGPDGSARAELLLELEGFQPLPVTAGGFGPRIDLLQTLQPLSPPSPPTPPAPVEVAPPPAATVTPSAPPAPVAPVVKKKHRRKKTGAKSVKSVAKLGEDDEDEEEPPPEDTTPLKTPH